MLVLRMWGGEVVCQDCLTDLDGGVYKFSSVFGLKTTALIWLCCVIFFYLTVFDIIKTVVCEAYPQWGWGEIDLCEHFPGRKKKYRESGDIWGFVKQPTQTSFFSHMVPNLHNKQKTWN